MKRFWTAVLLAALLCGAIPARAGAPTGGRGAPFVAGLPRAFLRAIRPDH